MGYIGWICSTPLPRSIILNQYYLLFFKLDTIVCPLSFEMYDTPKTAIITNKATINVAEITSQALPQNRLIF